LKRLLIIPLIVSLLVMMVSPVLALQLERPGGDIRYPSVRDENSFTDGKATVGLGVQVGRYVENWPFPPSNGGDYVELRISAPANTRQIVDYSIWGDSFCWHDNLRFTGDIEPDIGFWINMMDFYGEVRFYGGPGSAEYTSVFVSVWGFLCFDSYSSVPTNPYYEYTIPDPRGPNTFVAPFWREYVPDYLSTITYDEVYHPIGASWTRCLCISWNNFRSIHSSARNTFQAVLEFAPAGGMKHRQSRLWFQYLQIDTSAESTVGIEDQQGAKGRSYDYASIANRSTLLCEQTSNSAFAGFLTIKLDVGNDSEALTGIDSSPLLNYTRGYNVILDQDLPDENELYNIALEGGMTLLLEVVESGVKVAKGAGFIIGELFVIMDGAAEMARQQKLAHLLQVNTTMATASAIPDPDGIFYSGAVDVCLDITAYWVFTDPNNKSHDLNITAELLYYEYDAYGNFVSSPRISTTVTLKMNPDSNNSLETAQPVNEGDYNLLYIGRYDQVDYYTIGVDEGRVIDVWASAIRDPITTFYLGIVDSQGVTRVSSGPSFHEFVHCLTNYTGDWFIKVQAYADYFGLYNLSLNVKIAGNINNDGYVNAKDAVLLGLAFGSQSGGPHWNTNADINNDGFVNAKDATILGAHFGEEEEGYCRMPESGGESGSLASIGNGSLLSGFSSSLQVSPAQNTFYTTTKSVGDTFNVSIVANNVSSLYGWEFELSWTPGILNCTAQTINENVWSSYLGPWVTAPIDNPNGLYHQSLTAKAPASSFNGTAWLVNLTFQIAAAPPDGDQISTNLTLSPASGTNFCLFDSSALDIPHSFVHGLFTYVSPRHMRSDTQTVNGLQAYKLDNNQTATYLETNVTETESNTVYWGIRVWKRSQTGTETEITSGTPVAQVSRSVSGYGIQSATWSCSNVTLALTNSIVVRVYCMNGGTWTVQASFTTKQLNAQRLNPTIWRVYYWTKRSYTSGGLGKTVGYFGWGTATYNSRIENFTTSS